MVTQSINYTSDKKPIIAILLGAPFTSQNYERTGVPYLKENFEVVVLDCNAWLRIGYNSLRYMRHDYPRVETISSADDLDEVIGRLKPAYAIDFVGLETRFIQNILRMHGTQFVVQRTGAFPVPSRSRRMKGHLAMSIKNPRGILLRVIAKISNVLKEWRVPEPDVALLAGRKTLDAYTTRARNILWIASRDYYTYKNVQARSEAQGICLPVHDRYAVFIDDCIALGSDYKLMGLPPPVEPDGYYALLRQAFDRLERITGLQIIVAAHPNGKEIEGYASVFGGRQVHFDITAELCSKSDLVYSHFSTGLSYALLWRKPVIILTSHSLDQSYQGAAIVEWSIQLNCPLLFMESDAHEYEAVYERSREIDVEAYKHYIGNYIRSDEAAEVAPWQAFTNFVKQHPNYRP